MTGRVQPTDFSGVLDAVVFDANGLVPAIAQDAGSGQVLMMAWMNRDTLAETLASGRAVYWSRSRKSRWRKGDTSGHEQIVEEVRLDCDGDTLLLRVRQTGPACHTGRRACFFRHVKNGVLEDAGEV